MRGNSPHVYRTLVADENFSPRPENLERSVNLINEKLRGTKRLDLFECARVDAKVPVEDMVATLVKLKEQGKFDHIGMSECSAETLRRANKVRMRLFGGKWLDLGAVEYRFIRSVSWRLRSAPFRMSSTRETVRGLFYFPTVDGPYLLVIATAKDLGVAVAGYS